MKALTEIMPKTIGNLVNNIKKKQRYWIFSTEMPYSQWGKKNIKKEGE